MIRYKLKRETMLCSFCGASISTIYFNKHKKTKKCRLMAIGLEIKEKDLVPIEGVDGQRPPWFFVEPWPRIKSLIQTYPIYDDQYIKATCITKYIPNFIAEIMIALQNTNNNNVLWPCWLLENALTKINNNVEFSNTCEAIYKMGSKQALFTLIQNTCANI